VRDRKRRIYIDLKEEWMRPFLDYLKYKAHIGESILSNIYLNRTLKGIDAENFHFPPISLEEGYRSSLVSDCAAERLLKALDFESCTLNLLYYNDFHKVAQDPPIVDLRYKVLLIFIKTTVHEQTMALICRPDQRFSRIFGAKPGEGFRSIEHLEYCFKEDLNLSSIFPIEFSDKTGRRCYIRSRRSYSGGSTMFPGELGCSSLEIFEIRTVNSNIYPRDRISQEPSLATEAIPKEIAEEEETDNHLPRFIKKYNERVKYYGEQLSEIRTKVSKLRIETDFMAKYFSRSWLLPSSDLPTCSSSFDTLKLVIKTKTQIERPQRTEANKKRKRSGEGLSDQNLVSLLLDPIVYFNVEGEIFLILRSTILNVIPDSQLAVRVSGRWKEQETDVDEEGNLIVNCHKEAFKHILSSIQVQNCFHGRKTVPPFEIFVNAISRDAIEETLDFLLIKPASIRFLETAF
jgi:hypothetical protein